MYVVPEQRHSSQYILEHRRRSERTIGLVQCAHWSQSRTRCSSSVSVRACLVSQHRPIGQLTSHCWLVFISAAVESIVLCKSPGPTEDEKGPRAALGLDLLTTVEPNPHERDGSFYRPKRRGTRKDPARGSGQRPAYGESVQPNSSGRDE